jgi:hypothetical protein
MAALGGLSADTEVNNGGNGGGFSILADDDYQLEIIESDVKANSKGTGTNVELKVQVADGPNKGQWFFHSITSIQHTSAQAQAIGQGQLKALFEATGGEAAYGFPFHELDETNKLQFRPFWARVGHEEYFSNKHQKQVTKNVIEKFLWEGMPAEEEKAAAPPASKASPSAPPSAPASPAPAGKARPWSPKK